MGQLAPFGQTQDLFCSAGPPRYDAYAVEPAETHFDIDVRFRQCSDPGCVEYTDTILSVGPNNPEAKDPVRKASHGRWSHHHAPPHIRLVVLYTDEHGTKIVQGWPKLWAKFTDLIGIFSQSVGPNLAISANPVQFKVRGAKMILPPLSRSAAPPWHSLGSLARPR
jgi:hypothetical protein